jgi:hypothetical protein
MRRAWLIMSCVFRDRIGAGRKTIALFTTQLAHMHSRHLSHLPVRGETSLIDIRVHKGAMGEARRWQALVQPHVRACGRLDGAWDWPSMYQRSQIFERTFGRNASLHCIDIVDGRGMPLPLAMLLLSEGYPALDGRGQRSVFLWYLAAAPASALRAMGVRKQKPLLVLRAIIDAAIQCSIRLGYDGRVGLHAAPAGKDALFRKYRDDACMTALGDDVFLSLMRRIKGGKDGRYFWVDPVLARSLSASLDYLR